MLLRSRFTTCTTTSLGFIRLSGFLRQWLRVWRIGCGRLRIWSDCFGHNEAGQFLTCSAKIFGYVLEVLLIGDAKQVIHGLTFNADIIAKRTHQAVDVSFADVLAPTISDKCHVYASSAITD